MKTKRKRHSKFIERFCERQEMRYSRLNAPNNQSNNQTTTNDIQLQCLDANSLLLIQDRNYLNFRPESLTEATSSPAGSSLDLEWEHEYAATHLNQSWLALQEDATIEELSSDDEDCSSSEYSRNTSNSKLNNRNGSNRTRSRHTSTMDHRAKSNQNNRSTSRTSWSHISTPDSLEWDVQEDYQKFKSEEDSLDFDTMELLQEIEWLKNRVLSETGEGVNSDNQETES